MSNRGFDGKWVRRLLPLAFKRFFVSDGMTTAISMEAPLDFALAKLVIPDSTVGRKFLIVEALTVAGVDLLANPAPAEVFGPGGFVEFNCQVKKDQGIALSLKNIGKSKVFVNAALMGYVVERVA